MEERRCQNRITLWVWYDSPAKIGSVLHELQSGMGSGVILLQVEGCLLLCPDSGNSSLQLSERRDVAVRVDGLPDSRESRRITLFLSQKTVYITLGTEGSVWNFFCKENTHVATPRTAVLTPACSGDKSSYHQR
jgi:hypothetical protein